MAKNKPSRIPITPLTIIGSFAAIGPEIVSGIAAVNTTGDIQKWLAAFVCIFPVLVLVLFFGTLLWKPYVFYPPGEFGSNQDVGKYVEAMAGKPNVTHSIAPPAEKKDPQADAAQPPPQKPEEKQVALPKEGKTLSEPPTTKDRPKEAQDLWLEMFVAYMEGKEAEGEAVYAKLIELESNGLKKKEYELYRYQWRFLYLGDTQAFDKLKELTGLAEVRSLAYTMIGGAYRQLNEFEKAAQAFQASLTDDCPSDARAARTVQLAECYAKEGQVPLGLDTLMSALSRFNDAEDLTTIYTGIAGIYDSSGNQELRALAIEKAVELKPSDTDLRFKAAWAYSSHGLRDLALYHYKTILDFKPEADGVLNNLGVEFEHFKLPIHAVRNYEKAFALKNTLAAANLAYQYMEAGFFSQAKDVLGKAKAEADVHPNVGSAMASLSQKEETEREKTDAILKKASEKQKFLKRFAEGYFVQEQKESSFAGTWRSAGGQQFSVDQRGDLISANWIHSDEKRELSGSVLNRGAKIRIKTSSTKHAATLLGSLGGLFDDTEGTGYAYVSKDGRTMVWMLLLEAGPSFTTFTRTT